MIRIAISVETFEAIALTLPLGTVGYEAEPNAKGEMHIWIDDRQADKLAAMRGPGESYSDGDPAAGETEAQMTGRARRSEMQTDGEEIEASANDLLVFVDDTGHETFAGSQGFYGLGGCLALRWGYEHLKAKWREVRKAINGDPKVPLHASDITANPKPESFAVLRAFFEDPSFLRVAATTTKSVELPAGMHPCVPVMGQLMKEIEALVEPLARQLSCERIWIILESSERADPVVKRHFGELTTIDAVRTLPVEHRLMPKSANEPGLEVADFVVSAASSEVQRRLRGKSGHAPDFYDVFCRLPPEGCRYREVTRVTRDPNGQVAVDGVRLV
jgi:Protein of unknown function (DUF3800)